MSRIDRRAYADMYGPTTGDRVRLGDTELWIEVERDHTIYGEEVKFGGGKVIRDGMGQSQRTQAEGAVDTVITNALIVDHWGIVKADIGIKDGRISGIGKAGNPDVQPGVTIIIGPGTEVIAGEGLIATAGGIDSHIHFICPQQVEEALMSGVTTMIGGGTGPATGTNATTCTPGPWNLRRMLQAAEGLPINLGFLGKGNASRPAALEEQIEAGAMGLKLHEDWGTTPAAIDNCLDVAERYDVQVAIHTDTLNESGFVEDTLAAFKGRAIHTYHTEGAGGGHAPDIIRACGEAERAALLHQSHPALHGQHGGRASGHADGLPPSRPRHSRGRGLRRFAHPPRDHRRRGHPARSGRVLDDLFRLAGHGPGRRGHHPHLADRAQDEGAARPFAPLLPSSGEGPGVRGQDDNFRVKRYVAKYTINPAITHGISHLVGSLEVGKLADIVLWRPAFFGVKPSLIIKGGFIVAAPMGDPNASIPTPQPVHYRPMFGAFGGALAATCLTFVSKAALEQRRAGCAGPAADAGGGAGHPRHRQARSDPQRHACPGSKWTRRPTRCGRTACCSRANPPRCCRWRSAISCFEAARGHYRTGRTANRRAPERGLCPLGQR